MFDVSTRCIGFNGRTLVIGFTSGRFETLRTNHALIKGYSVLGVRAAEYRRRFPDKGEMNREAIWNVANDGRIRPHVHVEPPLNAVSEAFAMLRERQFIGKVVISCDQ